MAILRLDEATPVDNKTVGGKGAGLIRLVQLGMVVPDALIVTAAAYSLQANRCRLVEKIQPSLEKSDWIEAEDIAQEAFFSEPLDDNFSTTLSTAYRKMHVAAVAVRSSATCEDQSEASSAGQYDTFLSIQNENDLFLAVRQCWASLWNRRALMYRSRLGIDHLSAEMAVVIQKMVPADVSGVLFTIDPLTQDQSKIRIEAIAGLGDVLVSGSKSGKSLLVDRNSPANIGKRATAIPGLMDSAQVAELCAMALTIETALDGPQDIEFCIADRQIFLLQTRPITALNDSPVETFEPLGKPSLLDKMIKPFVDERYVFAPRPLDNIAVRLLIGGHLYTIKECGARVKKADEEAAKARIWRQAYRMPPIQRVWLMYVKTIPLKYRQMKTDWLSWWDGGPALELESVSKPVNLTILRDEELFNRAETILSTWEHHINKRMSAAGAIRLEFLLTFMVVLAVGPRRHRQVMADLMSGIQTPTVSLNEELWQLSRLARKNPEVLKCTRLMDIERLLDSEEGRKFADLFKAFIEKYGHREGACWYLTTPTWRQDQKQVWRILASLVAVDEPTGTFKQAQARHLSVIALIEKRLRFIPGLSKTFSQLWHRLYRLNVFREKSHYDLTRPLDALQEIAAEWGRRLLNRGILVHEADVGMLTYDEVRQWLCKSPPASNEVRKLVLRRRATYKLINAAWQQEREGKAVNGKELKGIAASPGIARGKVRIIHDEDEFNHLLAGEVLVTSYTNPAWTPLFSIAAAVITETGGPASHAAIVAREYKIPAIMAIPRVTQILKMGQDVMIDGNRGLVILQ